MLFLEGARHFDIHQGEWFERNIRVQVEFEEACTVVELWAVIQYDVKSGRLLTVD